MIYTFTNVISESDCNDIIHGIEQQWREPAVGSKQEYDPNIRQGKIKFPDPSKVPHGRVATKCIERVAAEMDVDVGDPLKDIDIQLTKYGPGDFYTWHADANLRFDTKIIRKLSGVLQLSNPTSYEGGELQIKSNAVISHKQGDLTVFPSCLEHQVTKVTSGTRFSLVLWYKGPRWR